MFFSRPIQWYHSHADPIWPDDTFNLFYAHGFGLINCVILLNRCNEVPDGP